MDIRPDYYKYTKWTYAEAAKEAGVKQQTVKNWLCEKKFKRGYTAGIYRVDAPSFLTFLKTNIPQG